MVKASLTRGTLHVVSANEYPWYAAASDRMALWEKALGGAVDVDALRSDLLAYVDDGPRSHGDFLGFIADWMEGHRRPGTELPSTSSWFMVRTYPWLLRTPDTTRIDAHPRDGYLTARTALPEAVAEGAVGPDAAFVHVVRSYLAAFGPAEVDDVKSFFLEPRITRVRAALAELEPELVTLTGPAWRIAVRPGERPPARLPTCPCPCGSSPGSTAS